MSFMCTEIEAKLKVESLGQIAERLAKLGADFFQQQLQRDYYFDDAQGQLAKTDRCFRLRRQIAGDDEKIFLTCKGPREQGKFKRREELEVELKDGGSAEKLLAAIGYKKALAFEKKRQVWRLEACSIGLDELPLLGFFVEIEGPDEEKIAQVQEKLGLADLPHIPQSYAFLIKNKLDESGKSQMQMFFGD